MAKIDLNKLIVLDIETLINCFTVSAMEYKTGAKKRFIIYDSKEYDSQAFELHKFLHNCVRTGYTFVTFNGLFFDMPILNYYYEWCSEKQDPLYELGNKFIIDSIYQKAQDIIESQDANKIKDHFAHYVSENDLFLPTIDVYKQKHYDRSQKATSLKWLQFTMRMDNIEEMAVQHDQPITVDQIEELMSYNEHDVVSTSEFFTLNKFESELRLDLSREYKLNLINASEPRMAREIFGTILAPQMGITYAELKKMRTIRKEVAFKDIIFPYIKFVTPQLQGVLADLKKIVVDCNPHSKQDFSYNFNYNGLQVYLGLGGIHACNKPGIYTPDADEYCRDSDGRSFYPNIIIQNDLKPAHLGDAFSKVFGNIYNMRQTIPKSDPRNYVYKIILNSGFGLSSEINSYFYDKQLTYSITVNGQLLLLMLCEALYTSVPGIRFVQKNTDGMSYIYKKVHQPIVEKIWAWWQKLTKIELEHTDYSKMVILDVNNYMAVDTKGKVKKKGRFETNVELHKNPSHLIIPKAVESYFIDGTPVDSTIKACNDIYDFCGGLKGKSNFKLNLYRRIGDAEIVEPQQKVTRYFVSSNKANSGLLVKDFDDGRKVSALAGTQVEILNKVPTKDASHYKIDHSFYIKKAREIVEQIEPKVTQTTLF